MALTFHTEHLKRYHGPRVGSAMFMDVETDFTILGYPGFAMILFLAAATGGVILLVSILLHDEKSDFRSRPRRGRR